MNVNVDFGYPNLNVNVDFGYPNLNVNVNVNETFINGGGGRLIDFLLKLHH